MHLHTSRRSIEHRSRASRCGRGGAELRSQGAQFSDTLKSLVQSMLAVEPAKRPTLNDIDDLACKQYLSLVRPIASRLPPAAA
jgi:hypothetical protein